MFVYVLLSYGMVHVCLSDAIRMVVVVGFISALFHAFDVVGCGCIRPFVGCLLLSICGLLLWLACVCWLNRVCFGLLYVGVYAGVALFAHCRVVCVLFSGLGSLCVLAVFRLWVLLIVLDSVI